MVKQNPDPTPPLNDPPPIAVPTEAEVRAADLEQDDAQTRQAQDRESRIREAAYSRAEQRGFLPGHEQEDWLEAERAIDRD